jgi:hypothetical protein
VTRAERLRRTFPAYYAVTLVLLLGTVQGAQACHRADTAVDTAVVPIAAMMEPPPKPEAGGASPASGIGGTDGEPAFTLERCATMTGDFADTCYAAVARDKALKDPDGALAVCAQVHRDEGGFECIADVAERHAEVEVAWSRATCETIPSRKWRDQCVFGISSAFALTDPAFALRNCEDAGQYTPFCRHDVNGERSTVDPAGAMAYCAALPVVKQTTCWHGIGKYIGRKDEAAAASWCAQVPAGELRGQCYHGLGWAAAEKDGAAAVDRCDALGEGRDSCVLGVAYQQWRYSPDTAALLCDRATAADEKRRCLDFMSGA